MYTPRVTARPQVKGSHARGTGLHVAESKHTDPEVPPQTKAAQSRGMAQVVWGMRMRPRPAKGEARARCVRGVGILLKPCERWRWGWRRCGGAVMLALGSRV